MRLGTLCSAQRGRCVRRPMRPIRTFSWAPRDCWTMGRWFLDATWKTRAWGLRSVPNATWSLPRFKRGGLVFSSWRWLRTLQPQSLPAGLAARCCLNFASPRWSFAAGRSEPSALTAPAPKRRRLRWPSFYRTRSNPMCCILIPVDRSAPPDLLLERSRFPTRDKPPDHVETHAAGLARHCRILRHVDRES
jgi:hypothetical protein